MFHLALAVNILFVTIITWASYRHFSRAEREPPGASALSVATGLGTIANVWLCLADPRPGAALSLAAIFVSALAFAVFFAALRATRDSGLSLAFSNSTPDAVVENGIYSIVRHPFYTSYCLYWLSWLVLADFHPGSVAILIAMLGMYVVAALREENLLAARHGDSYRALMRRTWRLVPGLY